jgi:hypothetical protein
MNITYIAGLITNTPNYRANFATVEAKLKTRGDIVFNPSTLPEGLDWDAYMPICYAMMDACNTIYLIHGWIQSKGAKMEYEYAVAKGMKIMIESEENYEP